MSFTAQRSAVADYVPVLQRVVDTLALMQDDREEVDIITFAESRQYLGLTLYPRQKLILKVYYRLPLDAYPCWCTKDGKAPDPDCELCAGDGWYDELEDVKRLIACRNKYALAYLPGLCQHHVTGECSRKVCDRLDPHRRLLSDAEIRERLLTHHAHILEVIGGRRGGKSIFGVVANVYEQYRLTRKPDPARHYNLVPGQTIGTANVATDEKQALILFDNVKNFIQRSPYFQALQVHMLQTELTYPGRGIYSRSFHSNSSSVRGNTLILVNLDEFLHMNQTTGRQSDAAMFDAIRPSGVTFGNEFRLIIGSSPLNKAGKGYELYELAESGEGLYILVFQMATWEMNPTLERDEQDIAASYQMDEDAAEMEYGAQFAEQVGVFIPYEAIDACGKADLKMATRGVKGQKYCLHLDLAKKRDSVGLVLCHWDKTLGEVVWDRIEEFNPQDGYAGGMLNSLGEIDIEQLAQYVIDLNDVYGFKLQSITYDQFNSQWLGQHLRQHFGDIEGKWINELFFSQRQNQEIFGSLRSLLVQGGVRYYRHPELMRQLAALAKTIKPSGAWKVEGPPGTKDDLADAAAAATWMCLQLALGRTSGVIFTKGPADKPVTPDPERLRHHRQCKVGVYCHWECPAHAAARQRLKHERTPA